MSGLGEVLAGEVLGQYDNGGGDEWVEVRSLAHVEAAVLAWVGERLAGARGDVSDRILDYENGRDSLEETSIEGYAGAALTVVAGALSVGEVRG